MVLDEKSTCGTRGTELSCVWQGRGGGGRRGAGIHKSPHAKRELNCLYFAEISVNLLAFLVILMVTWCDFIVLFLHAPPVNNGS